MKGEGVMNGKPYFSNIHDYFPYAIEKYQSTSISQLSPEIIVIQEVCLGSSGSLPLLQAQSGIHFCEPYWRSGLKVNTHPKKGVSSLSEGWLSKKFPALQKYVYIFPPFPRQ